jgi:hypothetical protein
MTPTSKPETIYLTKGRVFLIDDYLGGSMASILARGRWAHQASDAPATMVEIPVTSIEFIQYAEAQDQ